MADRPPTLIVAGGGTGGHVLAGVAVADYWRKKYGNEAKVVFVGAQGGIEEKLVPRAGYPLELLRLGALNQVSLVKKISTMCKLPLSFLRSALIVLKFRPDAVFGVGGYASGPVVLVSRLLGVLGLTRAKTAVLEQNSVPGITNRVLGRVVHHVFCTFPGTEKRFPGQRVAITGNPVRTSIKPLPAAGRDPFTIFIFGGSQGALGINSLVLEAIPFLEDLKHKLRFIHQTGEKDYERVVEGHKAAGSIARVEKFIHDMPAAYAEASLLICRAGSSTLSEIAAVGRASVLVPFPFASDNHQEVNARAFVDRGAAEILIQFKSSGEDLAGLIRKMVFDPARLARMEDAAKALYRPDSARDIVSLLMSEPSAKS